MPFTFRRMNDASARAVLDWRYEAPYDLYNHNSDPSEDGVKDLLEPAHNYYTLTDGRELVAYCCFGPDGRVPGGDYQLDALDIGLGVRPDLTGQGRGLEFVTAVIDFARATFAPEVLRVTIAQFNQRAQRVWRKAGFRDQQAFGRASDGLPFVILSRRA